MRTFEIHCGTRVVSHVQSHTARHAVTDYLRSMGCRDDEIQPLGNGGVSWRGAVYTAVEASDPSPPDDRIE
jgi:hypothetical protein